MSLCHCEDWSCIIRGFQTYVCLVLSHVQLFASPWTVAHQAPLSIGTLQERILEWVAMSSLQGSSQPRDWTQVSLIAGRFFTDGATRQAYLQWSDLLAVIKMTFFKNGIRIIRMRKLLLISGQERKMLSREVSVRPSTLSFISCFSIFHLSLLRIFPLLFSDTLGLQSIMFR